MIKLGEKLPDVQFNVPIGSYENPPILDAANLREVSAALAGVTLKVAHFRETMTYARRGDFIYFDPPYAPLSRTANFTSYTAVRFTTTDQQRLQQIVMALAARGCHVLVSNSTADEIAALYEENRDARAAGLRAMRVPARRAINSNAARRGPVEEFIITNVPGAARA